MKMLLLDVNHNRLEMVEANSLKDYYKYINCGCIDIVSRKIGDTRVNIVIDDEGALAQHPKLSAVDINGNVALYGNLLVASGRVTDDGELTELTEEELDNIINNVAEVITGFYKEPFKIFVEMGY